MGPPIYFYDLAIDSSLSLACREVLLVSKARDATLLGINSHTRHRSRSIFSFLVGHIFSL